MLDSPERDGFAKARHPTTFDVGNREPCMASTDIGSDQLHHNPAAASIADAPLSAPSAPLRIRANNSRPVPNGGGGATASSRMSHSPCSTSALSSPRWRRAGRCRRRGAWQCGPPHHRLGTNVDCGRDFARGTRHATIGDQRHPETMILEHAERRRELVQLRHSIRLRSLEAHHHDDIAVELARLERRQHRILIRENSSRSLDRPARRVDCAGLEGRAPEIALDQAHAAVGIEWIACRSQHGFVARGGRRVLPDQSLAIEPRFAGVVRRGSRRPPSGCRGEAGRHPTRLRW